MISEALDLADSAERVANNTEDTKRAKDTVCCARVMAYPFLKYEKLAACKTYRALPAW